ncbi:MAG: cupin domain-containing protein [Candidatus Firestonebacteria bacterium]
MADNKESIKGRAFNLAELVKYQKGNVVSKEIINKKTGTVTVFSFDKGEGLSEHVAPFDAMVYILDGTVKIEIAGKPNIVKKGECIILPAGKAHALYSVTRWKMLLVMIRTK